ncbi:MAG: diiron oxygenase, partial [Acidimicrobiales bacterium]
MSSGFATVVSRLSRLSVDHHFDAYDDIAWDSDEMAMNPKDSRFELPSYDPLAETDWYRSQPPE